MIDFGLSQLTETQLGEMEVMMGYKGSYNYVSKEMAGIFLKAGGLVDPYYNDLHCLIRCIQEYEPAQESSHETDVEYPRDDLSAHFIIKKIKCLLFNGTITAL